ncbi:MAG: hypothetical protein KA020_02785 [Planctomycetes bacterium]|nr:hypothetical protein [Planctomycetota bacterium]
MTLGSKFLSTHLGTSLILAALCSLPACGGPKGPINGSAAMAHVEKSLALVRARSARRHSPSRPTTSVMK